MNQGFTHFEQLDSRARGHTVLSWLCLTWPARREVSDDFRAQVSDDFWRRRLEAGEVTLEGTLASPEHPLQPGQRLAWHRPPWEEPAAPLAFTIVHQDADLLVVDKPSGLPTLPGANFQEHTLLTQVRLQFPGAVPMHRLGRHTSGLVLFALTEPARQRLQAAFRERRVRKFYLALASGHPQRDRFSIDAPIGPVPHPLLGTVHASSPSGKRSLSHVHVLERRQAPGGPEALCEVEIETGRPHQIRIHLAHAGHPLVGDPLYASGGLPNLSNSQTGVASVPGDGGYTLRAVELRLDALVIRAPAL